MNNEELIHSQEISPSIFVGNTITQINNFVGKIAMINARMHEASIRELKLKVNNLKEYEVVTNK